MKKQLELVVVQGGYNEQTNKLEFAREEIQTPDIDGVISVGNLRVTKDIFGKPFIGAEAILPAIVCVCEKGKDDKAEDSISDFFRENVIPGVIRLRDLLSNVIEATSAPVKQKKAKK